MRIVVHGQQAFGKAVLEALIKRGENVVAVYVAPEKEGAKADPLWKWLKSEKPGLLGIEAIKWNFTKFLVGKDGHVVKRYAPTEDPDKMRADIEAALAA